MTPRGGVIAAWVLLGLLTANLCWGSLRHDFSDATLVGDQASQLMQTVSLGHDGDLVYADHDVDNYKDVAWTNPRPGPVGLLFQHNDHGWSFAKPYGYSAVAVPLVRLLGTTPGVAATNTLLLLALLGLVIAILRLRLRGAAVPLVASALVLTSNVGPYAFVLYVELFTAVLVALAAYGFLRAGTTGQDWPMVVGCAATAFAVAEKSSLLLALLPLAVVTVTRLPDWRRRAAAGAVLLGVLLVGVLPYMTHSDNRTFNAYGGQRYASIGGQVPFSDPPGPTGSYVRVTTDEMGTPSYVSDQLDSGWDAKVRAAGTYLVGRHTGLLVFMPIALVVAGLAIASRRGTDARGVAVATGIVLYVLLYVLVFTDNYYGGGQSYGNRYFVQISPLVAALAVTVPIPSRRLVWGGAAAMLLGVAFMGPGLRSPSDAVERLERTSTLQNLLPFEYDQAGAIRFECGVTTPTDERLECEQEFFAGHGADGRAAGQGARPRDVTPPAGTPRDGTTTPPP